MNKQILIVVLQEGIYKMQEWTHQIIHVIIYIIFDSFSSNMKDNFPLDVLFYCQQIVFVDLIRYNRMFWRNLMTVSNFTIRWYPRQYIYAEKLSLN